MLEYIYRKLSANPLTRIQSAIEIERVRATNWAILQRHYNDILLHKFAVLVGPGGITRVIPGMHTRRQCIVEGKPTISVYLMCYNCF